MGVRSGFLSAKQNLKRVDILPFLLLWLCRLSIDNALHLAVVPLPFVVPPIIVQVDFKLLLSKFQLLRKDSHSLLYLLANELLKL